MHGSPPSTRGTPTGDPTGTSTTTLRIAETFVSRQGEGSLTGTDSFFIRTSGCNLRCWFCDTPYASWRPEGAPQSIDSLQKAAIDAKVEHVVLTGGEPLLPLESSTLTEALRSIGLHVTIETAGTVDRDVQCDLMSISPKFRSSTPDRTKHPRWHELHQKRRMPIDTMRRLIDRSDDYQVKFVVDAPTDLEELLEVTSALAVPKEKVWVMPQGITPEELDKASMWLSEWTDSQGFRYCDRMHIHWYGNRRGT
ncbi:7-carboxy-7-deazaguanine synthase QueE [Planctomycetes bacterium CA13]|uniref:7-carboxy-7-deazaguanine synthase QueE n=1 Tax=Novipirellula herctigrandis TaxID=2527986 RepID=UPI0011B3E2EA